jgi:hypothetical protein
VRKHKKLWDLAGLSLRSRRLVRAGKEKRLRKWLWQICFRPLRMIDVL